MTERKMKKERIRYYGEMEGSLKSVIDDLQEELDKYGPKAYLDKDVEYDYYSCNCSSGYPAWYIEYEREETDAEMQKRLKAAEKARATRAKQKARNAEKKVKETKAKEAKERKELARLQKKYGEE